MARTSTLLQLRTWARELAGIVGDPNVGDSVLTALANRHVPEVYDALVDAGPPEYYASTTTVTTIAGTTLYALPADFRTLLDVYAQESSGVVRSVDAMRNGTRSSYRAPTGVWVLEMEYVPAATLLVADGDTFDGVSGWEELIANLMARDVMIGREADPSAVINSIANLQARIGSRARNRDRGHPKYTTDLDDVRARSSWASVTNNRIACYRLRAGNLELYESHGGAP
jgi:hypothetical protein